MMDTVVKIQRNHPGSQLPQKANPSDACFDLMAPEDQIIAAGSHGVIDVGIALELEQGWEAQIRGRSGLAKRGIVVHPGTIDHLYRLNLKVLVHNLGDQPWTVSAGDRVAQMKVSKIWEVELLEASVSPTDRGGLGSTGR